MIHDGQRAEDFQQGTAGIHVIHSCRDPTDCHGEVVHSLCFPGVECLFHAGLAVLRDVQLFNQIGMPKGIFDGTASDEEKLTYYNNTISPVLATISDEFTRKFLSKTARTQGHAIDYFQNFFKLIPVSKLAEIVDKFTRNEVLSPNEVRMLLGYLPSEDPKANDLRNRNLNTNSDSDPSMLPGMDELDVKTEEES